MLLCPLPLLKIVVVLPVIDLKRNSSSPADADYIGQLKFKGENDADQEVVYAKLSGKISDVTDGTEDGLIEIALRHGGSNRIVARFTGNELKLLNGSGIDVASGGTIDGELLYTTTTAASGDDSTKIATTAFVKQEIDALKALVIRLRPILNIINNGTINLFWEF